MRDGSCAGLLYLSLFVVRHIINSFNAHSNNTSLLNIRGFFMWHEWPDWCSQKIGGEHRKCASFFRSSSPLIVFVWEGLEVWRFAHFWLPCCSRLHGVIGVSTVRISSNMEGVFSTAKLSRLFLHAVWVKRYQPESELLIIHPNWCQNGFVYLLQRMDWPRSPAHSTTSAKTVQCYQGKGEKVAFFFTKTAIKTILHVFHYMQKINLDTS